MPSPHCSLRRNWGPVWGKSPPPQKIGSSALAPPLRSQLGSEASVTARRRCWKQTLPRGAARAPRPQGQAPRPAAGAAVVGHWPSTHAQSPLLSFRGPITAEPEGTHFPPSALTPGLPRAAPTPTLLSQGQRGGHTLSPEGGDEGRGGRAQRSVAAPSWLMAWVRGHRPHLSSAFWPVALAAAVF